ncbi:hypothetical protein GGR38_001458 [Novosphingobium sediminicola]|uniref:Uncharacterized protein n=1 Tax=Novosphingobium sediminicola TaxID=563162 RepID=A0A7W6CKA7_9SPHN|nr:hypothetical protein [Novosphingobium sediminicola]
MKSASTFAKQGVQDETEAMNNPEKPTISAPSREERLAAKLRENLRRRKAQSRAMEDTHAPTGDSQA